MASHPEKQPQSAFTPGGEVITQPVAEQNLIVGEDARVVQLQAFVVGKQTSRGLTMALDLVAAPFAATYFPDGFGSECVPTEVMQIDRSRRQTFRVTYTPAETGAEIWIYPQVSQGEVPENWTYVPAIQGASTPVAGPTDPPSVAEDVLGYRFRRPFHLRGTLVADTSYTELFMLGPGDDFPACIALRFVLRDTSEDDPGAVTIYGTQE